MRASVAINLGDTLKRRNPHHWLTDARDDYERCGCALGGVPLALGMHHVSGWWEEYTYPQIVAEYPWMVEYSYSDHEYSNAPFNEVISHKFSEVCAGRATFESLVDWVRSIEPDCDCNRYNCDCSAKDVLESPKEDMAYAESQDTLPA